MVKPKYLKEKYNIFDFDSYKDVPGWVNDAEFIYKEMVDKAQEGDHFVEIGTFLGQSTTHMAQLIKDSKKKISFDTIDIFWIIPHALKHFKTTGHPKEFLNYYTDVINEWGMNIVDVIQHPMRILGVDKYVNFITCDERYAHGIYEDNSIQFLWIDGDHGKDIVYNDLINFWPKIKKGGYVGGDDIHYEEVLSDVEKFTKEFNLKAKYDYNSFLIHKEK